MTDRPGARCPECGRAATRRISGGAGLIFKGSGFYITEYGKDGKGPRQDKETDSKPEAAPAKTEESAPKSPTPEAPDQPTKKKASRERRDSE
jgi:hypothetical protein